MVRWTVCVLAMCALAACASDPTWAPDSAVRAARHSPAGEPPSVTLYTVVNNRTGSGAHTAILINASERVMFDPAGTWHHPKLPIRNDVHFGMTDKAVAFYIDYHARETYDVIEQRVVVTPEVAEAVLRRAKDHGAVSQAMCAQATSAILRGVPGFTSLPATWFPKQLSKAFGALPGVTERVITDDDDDSNHGVLLVQANGDPLE